VQNSQVQRRVAITCFAAMMVSSPAVLSINPLVLTPIAEEFGWGRSAVSAGYLVAAPVMAGMYLAIGPAIDRWGARRIVVPGVVAFAISLLAMTLLTGSVAQFLLIRGITAVAASFVTGIAFGKIVSSHFTTNRGLLLGICLGLGSGLGMVLLPIAGAPLLAAEGWRAVYLGAAVVTLVIGLPAALLLPDDRPARMAPGEQRPVQASARSFLDSGTYRFLLGSTFLGFAAVNGVIAHLVAIGTDRGLTAADGAVALSFYAAAMMSGQFAIGPLLDRLPTARVGAVGFVLLGLGILAIMGGQTRLALLGSATLIGLGSGTQSGLLPYVLPRFFGLPSFGTLYAWIFSAAALGAGAGPFIMGWVFDEAHSYAGALAANLLIAAALAAAMLLLPGYRFQPDGRTLPSA
jgi:MFS family permease